MENDSFRNSKIEASSPLRNKKINKEAVRLKSRRAQHIKLETKTNTWFSMRETKKARSGSNNKSRMMIKSKLKSLKNGRNKKVQKKTGG